MLYSFGDQNLFIFPAKTHVLEKIEIITAIVTHTSKLWVSPLRLSNLSVFLNYS